MLIDAGISCREIEKRLLRLELSIKKVKAVFISHEHSDHIRGIDTLARKHQLPVYITPLTLSNSSLQIPSHLQKTFRAYDAVTIGNLQVIPFPKIHDAADPFSFVVEGNGVRIGIMTDIGAPCSHVIQNLRTCDAAFLESNYDKEMLSSGRYPYYLKKRISGGKGHLSNHEALEIFHKHGSNLKHLILSHLSKENNSEEIVRNLFENNLLGTNIVVASRYNESEVIQVYGTQNEFIAEQPEPLQLSLFD